MPAVPAQVSLDMIAKNKQKNAAQQRVIHLLDRRCSVLERLLHIRQAQLETVDNARLFAAQAERETELVDELASLDRVLKSFQNRLRELSEDTGVAPGAKEIARLLARNKELADIILVSSAPVQQAARNRMGEIARRMQHKRVLRRPRTSNAPAVSAGMVDISG